MKQLYVSPEAQADLWEASAYIAERRESAAADLIRRVQDTFDLLRREPGAGRSREDLLPGLRSFPVLPYVVFYRLVDDGVEIVRILHGARDAKAHL